MFKHELFSNSVLNEDINFIYNRLSILNLLFFLYDTTCQRYLIR